MLPARQQIRFPEPSCLNGMAQNAMQEKNSANPSFLSPKQMQAGVIVVALILISILTWFAWPNRTPDPKPNAKTLAELIEAINRNEPDAVQQAQEVAGNEWPESIPVLQKMLSHDGWRVRWAACKILADRNNRRFLPLLMPRCSDRDWRVRAVAFEALSRIHPLPVSASLRDTPLEQRERLLLEWLVTYDAHAVEDKALGPGLCELYADVTHVQLGRLLTERWWQSWEQEGQSRPAEWPPGRTDTEFDDD